MLLIMRSTKLTTCHTIITSKQHLLHSNRWKPSIQTTSIRLTFQSRKNMFSTPTLFNLFITTLYQKAALYWSLVPQLPFCLNPSLPWYCTAWRDSRRRCVCSAAAWRTLVLVKACWSCPVPTWRWDTKMQVICTCTVKLTGRQLSSVQLRIWSVSLVGRWSFWGRGIATHTHRQKLSTKRPQYQIISKLLDIRTQTSWYWNIILHSPSHKFYMEPKSDGFQDRNLLFQGASVRWTIWEGKCVAKGAVTLQSFLLWPRCQKPSANPVQQRDLVNVQTKVHGVGKWWDITKRPFRNVPFQ